MDSSRDAHNTRVARPGVLRLTSLLRVEERLLEAEHFAKRMARGRDEAIGYDLNAFLSAARSVTFLLQKEFSKVDGFAEWWAHDRAVLDDDPAARFFLELRNYSQKEGRISLVGVALHDQTGSRRSRWSYRFAGTSKAVPAVLLNRDIIDCCREHLAKLAKVLLRFSNRFPFHACPSRALTPEGVKALGINIDEVFATLGYPQEWTQCAPDRGSDEHIRLLAQHVDAVDFRTIRRISRFKPQPFRTASPDGFGERLAGSMVAALERRRDEADTEHILREFVLSELLGSKPNDKP